MWESGNTVETVRLLSNRKPDTKVRQEEKHKPEDEMSVLVEMTQNIVAENARVAQNQDEYQKRYDGLVQRYDTAVAWSNLSRSAGIRKSQSPSVTARRYRHKEYIGIKALDYGVN